MGTRSFVGVMVGEQCRAIYVHYDGYLSGVGAELQDYKTQAEVEELIADGDRSSLTDGFYKERGETGVNPKDYATFNKLFEAADGSWAEWYYVFKDGEWYCGNTYSGSKLCKTLTPYAEACEVYKAECEAEECAE